MKVALTVWENRISPVFDSARTLLIAEIKDKKIVKRDYERLNPELPTTYVGRMTDSGISALICGAISQVPAGIIESAGIKLIPFVSGDVEDILAHYSKGMPISPKFSMPGCSESLPETAGTVKPNSEKREHRCREALPAMGKKMISILVVSPKRDFFSELSSQTLNRKDVLVSRVSTGEKALVMVSGHPYSLVVVDEKLPDMAGLEFVEKTVATNPMINSALVSRLSGGKFHEASEGLGILMQLPPEPDAGHAKDLITRLESILQR
ncbi:MAG: NifB/NifX family molybdenum-iron cluster-binding protein [Desulfobacterales bacterium]